MSVKGQVFIGQEGDKMEQNFVLIDPKICTLFFFFLRIFCNIYLLCCLTFYMSERMDRHYSILANCTVQQYKKKGAPVGSLWQPSDRKIKEACIQGVVTKWVYCSWKLYMKLHGNMIQQRVLHPLNSIKTARG